MTTTRKYPDVTVRLSGQDGNAFMILGTVEKALRWAGAPEDDLSAYIAEATTGDYNDLLHTTMLWVNVT